MTRKHLTPSNVATYSVLSRSNLFEPKFLLTFVSPLSCLNHITRLLCPLCRNGFDASGFIKIHIDVDNVRSSPRAIKAGPTSSSPAEDEARRLQEAIASVANAGTTEARLRQLIEEGRTFLASQPRTLVSNALYYT